jgi:VWFA-related protein
MVRVGVRDARGRAVESLKADQFELFDNGFRQKLVQCSLESGPREAVIVFDQSESMRPAIPRALEAIRAFVNSAASGDKISVITVRESAGIGVPPTEDTDQVLRELGPGAAEGRTALFDGVYLALDRIRRARTVHSAVLVLSDGGDNSSTHKPEELEDLAFESGAAIHSIVTMPAFPRSNEEQGQKALKQLAEQTGGWFWEPKGTDDVRALVRRLQRDPHYVLAYPAPEGRDHQIKVRVKGRRGLRITWRKSYTAADD